MYQRRLFRLLLLPSLLSGSIAALLSLAYMAYAGWQYIQDNEYFYDYLFGAYGTRTYLWEHPFSTPPWLTHVFKSSLAYFVLVITLGLIGGAIAYGVLQTVSALRTQKSDLSLELAAAGAGRSTILIELVTRMALRIMSLMGWGLYMLFFVSAIAEAITTALHIGIDSIHAGHTVLGVVQLGGDTLLLIAATHVHVYFLRLVALRPRILGSDQSVG